MATAKKKSTTKARSKTQATMAASVTRKQNANRRRYESGEITLGTLRSLNAAVTVAARRSGMVA